MASDRGSLCGKVDIFTHNTITDIAEMIDLAARPNFGFFNFNEVADADLFTEIGAGAQAGEGADDGIFTNGRIFEMAEGLHMRACFDGDAFATE